MKIIEASEEVQDWACSACFDPIVRSACVKINLAYYESLCAPLISPIRPNRIMEVVFHALDCLADKPSAHFSSAVFTMTRILGLYPNPTWFNDLVQELQQKCVGEIRAMDLARNHFDPIMSRNDFKAKVMAAGELVEYCDVSSICLEQILERTFEQVMSLGCPGELNGRKPLVSEADMKRVVKWSLMCWAKGDMDRDAVCQSVALLKTTPVAKWIQEIVDRVREATNHVEAWRLATRTELPADQKELEDKIGRLIQRD